jgi:hypothetical protein
MLPRSSEVCLPRIFASVKHGARHDLFFPLPFSKHPARTWFVLVSSLPLSFDNFSSDILVFRKSYLENLLLGVDRVSFPIRSRSFAFHAADRCFLRLLFRTSSGFRVPFFRRVPRVGVPKRLLSFPTNVNNFPPSFFIFFSHKITIRLFSIDFGTENFLLILIMRQKTDQEYRPKQGLK